MSDYIISINRMDGVLHLPSVVTQVVQTLCTRWNPGNNAVPSSTKGHNKRWSGAVGIQ